VAVELGARGGEALPQFVFDRLLQTRASALQGLPLFQEVAQRLARLLPVGLGGVLSDDGLGALDDGRAVGQGLRLGGLTLLASNLLAFLGGLLDRRDALAQRGDVADDVGGSNLLTQRRESLIDVARAQGAQAILEELDRGLEIGVATLVQGIGRRGNTLREAADDALLVAVLDIDSPVLTNAGEGVLRHLRRCDRRGLGFLGSSRHGFGSGFVVRNRRLGHDIPS
jgi:hypothetical protein